MKYALFPGVFVLLTLVSCKKFTHDVAYPAFSCELCSYADSLSGVYAGWTTGALVPLLPAGQPCSVFVETQHIFLNLNTQLDSTTMYFSRTIRYDSLTAPVFSADTFAITDRSGAALQDPVVKLFDPLHYNHLYDEYTHYGYVIYLQYNAVRQ